MVSAEVIGTLTISVAGQSGNFQLNVMLPLIGYKLIESERLLASVVRQLADAAIAGFTVNETRLADALDRNPILVTALNPVIGYEKGAAIAKKAYAEGRPVLEVASSTRTCPPHNSGRCSIRPSSPAEESREAPAGEADGTCASCGMGRLRARDRAARRQPAGSPAGAMAHRRAPRESRRCRNRRSAALRSETRRRAGGTQRRAQ